MMRRRAFLKLGLTRGETGSEYFCSLKRGVFHTVHANHVAVSLSTGRREKAPSLKTRGLSIKLLCLSPQKPDHACVSPLVLLGFLYLAWRRSLRLNHAKGQPNRAKSLLESALVDCRQLCSVYVSQFRIGLPFCNHSHCPTISGGGATKNIQNVRLKINI